LEANTAVAEQKACQTPNEQQGEHEHTRSELAAALGSSHQAFEPSISDSAIEAECKGDKVNC